MYGRTRSGKSAQIGEFAKNLKLTQGLNTRVYHIDNGGYGVLRPHIENGFLEVIEQQDSSPWHFLAHAAQGHTRDSAGKWVKGDLTGIGMIAFEGMTAFADAFMTDLADRASDGLNVGGSASVSFKVQSEGESLTVGGNNMSHYNVVQNRITKEVWASQKLNVPYIVWTASVSKDDDSINSGKVLGPAVVGKALTSEVPRWFQYTFRLDAIPAMQGKPERHVLYLGLSQDVSAGNATSLGNTRVPMGIELPATVEPASLVGAMKLITDGEQKAKEAMKKELEGSVVSRGA